MSWKVHMTKSEARRGLFQEIYLFTRLLNSIRARLPHLAPKRCASGWRSNRKAYQMSKRDYDPKSDLQNDPPTRRDCRRDEVATKSSQKYSIICKCVI